MSTRIGRLWRRLSFGGRSTLLLSVWQRWCRCTWILSLQCGVGLRLRVLDCRTMGPGLVFMNGLSGAGKSQFIDQRKNIALHHTTLHYITKQNKTKKKAKTRKTKQNKTKQNKTKQNKTKQNKTNREPQHRWTKQTIRSYKDIRIFCRGMGLRPLFPLRPPALVPVPPAVSTEGLVIMVGEAA